MHRTIPSALIGLLFISGAASAQDTAWDIDAEAARFETCYANTPVDEAYKTCDYQKKCIDDGPNENSTSQGMAYCALKGSELWDATAKR